jgi:hypothetical protein
MTPDDGDYHGEPEASVAVRVTISPPLLVIVVNPL